MFHKLLNKEQVEDAFTPETDRSKPTQLCALTSIRFFLAFSVLCYHYDSNFPLHNSIPKFLILAGSSLAVPAFFCLSGFVLTYQYQNVDLDRDRDRAKYWIARAARLLPVYWLCVFLSLAFTPRLGLYPDLKNLFLVLLANLCLLQAWVPNKDVYWAFDPPAYTLSVETFFYLLFPLIITCISKKRWLALALVVGTSYLLQKVIAMSLPAETVWREAICPLAHSGQFLLGVGTGTIFIRCHRSLVQKWLSSSLLASVLEIAAVIATIYYAFHDVNLSLVGFAALIFLCGFEKGICSRILSLRLLLTLGGMSYSTYLLHYLLIYWLVYNGVAASKISGLLPFELFVACTLGASYAIFKWVEQPLRQQVRHIGDVLVQKRDRQRSSQRITPLLLKNKPALPALLSILICLLVCYALFRAAAITPWVESTYGRVVETSMPLVAESDNIVFGQTLSLTRMYMYRGVDGLIVSSYWRPGQNSQRAQNLGVHLLDRDSNIVGQCDHPLVPGGIGTHQTWHDRFVIPEWLARKATKIGLLVYDDPNHTSVVKGGNCDWNNHRILFSLKK